VLCWEVPQGEKDILMADKPILFSAPMVKALFAGTKTQTRRILKPHPQLISDDYLYWIAEDGKCHEPRWRVGDRIWVREAWRPGAWREGHIAVDYRATPEENRTPWLDVPETKWEDIWIKISNEARDAIDAKRGSVREIGDGFTWDRGDSPCRWRTSIFMPRYASRLTLTVTDVRVQRLQDISAPDAVAEGIAWRSALVDGDMPGACYGQEGEFEYPEAAYAALWDAINGPGAWDANPFVVALTFSVEHRNIDANKEPTP